MSLSLCHFFEVIKPDTIADARITRQTGIDFVMIEESIIVKGSASPRAMIKKLVSTVAKHNVFRARPAIPVTTSYGQL